MKPTALTVAVALCLAQLLIAAGAYGEKVYKWVDDKGVTHFSAAPPASGKPSETVNIRTGESADANGAPVLPAVPPVAAETPPAEATGDLEAARLEQNRARCEQARETEADLADKGRVRVRDMETGEYRILPHEELVAWREEVAADIRRYCP